MRTNRVVLLAMLSVAVFSHGQSNKVASVDPPLRDLLMRDAPCNKTGAAVTDADRAEFAQSSVRLQTSARGRGVVVIAEPESVCGCQNGNCPVFVYAKFNEGYKLVLKDLLASLTPMHGLVKGFPPLSAKFEVTESQTETTIYNWDGKGYRASVCATVIQHKNQKLPSIVKHACP
ncbi:MAG TPA: hypothetical protein VEW69_07410 [Alphaproteobacteria bacterium]|nr:hypothetical protein [Alphaproteobacteria bacterium]